MADRYVLKKESKFDCVRFQTDNFDELQILGDCDLLYNKETEIVSLTTQFGVRELSDGEWLVASLNTDYDAYVAYDVYDNGAFNSKFQAD